MGTLAHESPHRIPYCVSMKIDVVNRVDQMAGLGLIGVESPNVLPGLSIEM
jgi:hypothetical protein